MKILNKIFSLFKKSETVYETKDGISYKVGYDYLPTDDLSQPSNHAEAIKQAIKDYKLPISIYIDDTGNILESYEMIGSPYSWRMKKYIDKISTNNYNIIEEFEDSKDNYFRRVFEGSWCTELSYLKKDGSIEEQFVKRDKKGKFYLLNKDTESLYKFSGERVYLKKPEDFASHVNLQEAVFNKKLIYHKVVNGDSDFKLGYITSLYPTIDGSEGNGLINGYTQNIFDGNIKK